MSFEIELRRSLIRLIKSNRPRQMERRIVNNHTHYTTVMDHIDEEDLQSIFAALRSQSSEVWIAGDGSGNCQKGYTVIQDSLAGEQGGSENTVRPFGDRAWSATIELFR